MLVELPPLHGPRNGKNVDTGFLGDFAGNSCIRGLTGPPPTSGKLEASPHGLALLVATLHQQLVTCRSPEHERSHVGNDDGLTAGFRHAEIDPLTSRPNAMGSAHDLPGSGTVIDSPQKPSTES